MGKRGLERRLEELEELVENDESGDRDGSEVDVYVNGVHPETEEELDLDGEGTVIQVGGER